MSNNIRLPWYLVCDHRLTEPEGTFVSPGYPQDYPAAVKCSWTIIAPAKYYIILKFNEFVTEAGHDMLEVIEASNSYKRPTYSGISKPDNYISRSNVLVLKFSSDQTEEKKGFNITYKFRASGKLAIETSLG